MEDDIGFENQFFMKGGGGKSFGRGGRFSGSAGSGGKGRGPYGQARGARAAVGAGPPWAR